MDGAGGLDIAARSVELNNIGTQLYTDRQLGSAYLHFMAALVVDPSNYLSWMNLGAVLCNMQKGPAAEVACRRALLADPNSPGILNNLANALSQQRKYADAIKIYHKIIETGHTEAGVHHNLGLAYYMLEQFASARKEFEIALHLRPDVTVIQNDLAMTRLALGDLDHGLADYEARWVTLFKSKVWELAIPEWKGENLQGKRILVHHEQGFGDSIMLCRFVNELLTEGAQVTISMPKELVRLMQHNFPLCPVLKWDEMPEATDYDFHSPLLSVMRWLQYNSPHEISPTPYLTAPGTFGDKLPGKLKVGICWSSGDHGFALQKRRRIVPLEKLLPLAAKADVKLIGLQKGDAVKDIEFIGAQAMVLDCLARAEDFADTADIISQLDIVISVDSAVAHLAAAMGKPVIMLSPSPRCWRWWGSVDGLPWYQDLSVAQQSVDGSWDDAVDEVFGIFEDLTR